MIQISYKLTKEEIYRGLVATSKSRFVTKLMTGFGLVMAAAMLFIVSNRLANGGFAFSVTSVFPLFLGIYLLFLSEITAKFQVPNIIKTKNAFTEQVRVKIDKSAFRITGETSDSQIKWDKFAEIVETKEFFLLKASDGIANILPKRAFTEEDNARFKILLSSLNGPKVKLN